MKLVPLLSNLIYVLISETKFFIIRLTEIELLRFTAVVKNKILYYVSF